MGKKTKEEKNDSDKNILYRMGVQELHGKRFHYDGWMVEDEGKSVIIKVATEDNTKGEILLPWEEINEIRQFGWERQEEAAKKKMRGKRVHCRHLQSFHAILPACCQIGLKEGPCNVNCLTCPYIDGYIEEFDPKAKPEEIKIDMKNYKVIEL